MQKVTGVKINMNKIHFGKLRSPIVFYGMETPEVHLCITFFKENVIEGNLQKYKKKHSRRIIQIFVNSPIKKAVAPRERDRYSVRRGIEGGYPSGAFLVR